MSISITINDINNLTETERAVLRLVADNSVATSLKAAVRDMTGSYEQQAGRAVRHIDGDVNNNDLSNLERLPILHNHTPDAPLTKEQIAEAFNVPVDKLSGATYTHAVVDEHGVAPVTFLAGCGHETTEEGYLLCDACHEAQKQQMQHSAPASAELDSQGLPWDKRIHSSSRAKIADGSWRKFRGVDPALVAEVEAELRAVQNAPAAPATHGSAELDKDAEKLNALAGDGAAGPTVEDVTVGTVPPPPPAATAAIAPPPPPAATGDAPMTFAQMMPRITPHLVSGAISQERVNEVCASLELPHLAALGARPDLIPAALAALESGVTTNQ